MPGASSAPLVSRRDKRPANPVEDFVLHRAAPDNESAGRAGLDARPIAIFVGVSTPLAAKPIPVRQDFRVSGQGLGRESSETSHGPPEFIFPLDPLSSRTPLGAVRCDCGREPAAGRRLSRTLRHMLRRRPIISLLSRRNRQPLDGLDVAGEQRTRLLEISRAQRAENEPMILIGPRSPTRAACRRKHQA